MYLSIYLSIYIYKYLCWVVRRLSVPILEQTVEDGRVERGVVGPERRGEEVRVGQEGHLEDLCQQGLDLRR